MSPRRNTAHVHVYIYMHTHMYMYLDHFGLSIPIDCRAVATWCWFRGFGSFLMELDSAAKKVGMYIHVQTTHVHVRTGGTVVTCS